EDPGIQTAIVEILYASSDQKITRLLSNLTQADNHAFRLVHYLLRARSGTAPDEEALKDIAAIISNLNTRNDFFDRLIQETRLFQSGRIDGVLIRHPLESFRLAGWANQANNIGNTDPALLNTGLEDNSLLVRQTLVNALLGAPFSVSPEIWNQMTNSHFADIRMGAAEILTRLGVLTRMEELFPLLIDEDSRVRAAALRVLVKHKPPGWQKILIRSLKDRDGNVQRQSVNHLFASGQEGIGLLQTWEKANRQSALALFIRSEFSRRRISPLAGSEQQRDSVP
ncbi:MAG: HEAT repeat domain-containing protein, partial [Gammaproteobacteria bacterium]|nr:HEAT repeat domain-containing protein [Gammaproteobacteria bacterium]